MIKIKNVILKSIPILILFSFALGAYMELAKGKAEIERDIALNMALVESNVSLSIRDNLDKMKGLATHIGLNTEFRIEEINYYVEEILNDDTGIINNIGVFEDTTAVYVYPYEANKAVADIDLSKMPAFVEDALQVKNDLATIITPPAEVVQGGRDIIIRLPIVTTSGDYWGQIGYMMRYEKVIDSLGIKGSEYYYRIDQVNKLNDKSYLVYDSGFRTDAIGDQIIVDLPSSYWRISISNKSKFDTLSIAFWLLTSFGLIFYFLSRKIIKELEFSQFMTRGLVEASPNFVLVSDKQKNIVDCSISAIEIMAIAKNDLIGKNLESLCTNRIQLEDEQSELYKFIIGNSNKESVIRINVEGESKFYKMQESRMTRDRGFIFSGYDINEIKKQEVATEKARRIAEETAEIQSRFLANMSHEIRTPLNGIIGMIELSMLEDTGKNVTEYLAVAKSSAKSLLTILNDILDYSKLEVKKMTVSSEYFEVMRLTNDLKTLFAYTANEKGLNFVVNVDQRIPNQLLSDCIRIRQVLTNLLSNAFKFTSHGSVSLTVSLLEKDDEMAKVAFSVRDTGMGISKEKIQNLFQRFNQLDGSITRNYGGTGLGLAISKGLVELLGGQIKCTLNEGEGSNFTFVLQLGYSDEKSISNNNHYNLTQGSSSEEKFILVVDDDSVNRKVMDAVLKRLGYRVALSDNGRQAVEFCKEEMFDMILMDISMPVMGGYQALKEIGALPGYTMGEIPIIAFTAFALDGDREKCLSAGFSNYLSKPIEIEDLANEVSKWLN